MQEATIGDSGFGESLRGGGAICFGTKAIDDFLTQGNLSYIVRAHEAHSEGVSLRKGAKVFTVFSTSKDHGQGKGATCGCILVDFQRLLVINRSTKYKNKYVHRRDSVSLANLTLQEFQAQVELGLVVQPDSEDDEVCLKGTTYLSPMLLHVLKTDSVVGAIYLPAPQLALSSDRTMATPCGTGGEKIATPPILGRMHDAVCAWNRPRSNTLVDSDDFRQEPDSVSEGLVLQCITHVVSLSFTREENVFALLPRLAIKWLVHRTKHYCKVHNRLAVVVGFPCLRVV